jgi:hypothetical protein
LQEVKLPERKQFTLPLGPLQLVKLPDVKQLVCAWAGDCQAPRASAAAKAVATTSLSMSVVLSCKGGGSHPPLTDMEYFRVAPLDNCGQKIDNSAFGAG